jgi:hypothetical protein
MAGRAFRGIGVADRGADNIDDDTADHQHIDAPPDVDDHHCCHDGARHGGR